MQTHIPPQSNNCAQQLALLSDVAISLTSTENFSESMNHVLGQIGEFLQVNRVYIFEDNKASTHTTNIYEWCSKGTTPQINELQHIPFTSLPSWKPFVYEEGILRCHDISTLPEDLIAILGPQDIQSILAMPLKKEGKPFGFIGFDDTEQTREWNDSEVAFLQTLAVILSNTYNVIATEQRLQLAIEATGMGIWDWDVETGELDLSEEWAQILGYTLSELEPITIKTWQIFKHPEDVTTSKEELEKHFAKETDQYVFESRMKHKDGHWVWVLDHGKVVEWTTDGKPKRMTGTNTDITSRKEAERSLKEQTETLEKMNKLMVGRELRMVELKKELEGTNFTEKKESAE